jgi:hypothetical protein
MSILSQRSPGAAARRVLHAVAAALCLAAASPNHAAGAKETALDKALDAAMTPGEGQKRLEPMVGTFSVEMRTWADPSKPPVESSGSAVGVWVLGNRYVQTMLSINDKDATFSGIGYAGYDNVAKVYQAAWMDDGSTGMVWYSGRMDAAGRSAVMKATTTNPSTGKPSPLELRMALTPDGRHSSELWGVGLGTQMFKMMELHYTRVGK